MSLSADVVEALNEFNEDVQNEIYAAGQAGTRQNPLPDPGTYDAVFQEVDVFTSEGAVRDSDGNETEETTQFLNVELAFRVVGGPRDGTKIARMFWGNSEYDQRDLSDFVTIITGDKPTGPKQAVLSLDGKEGTAVRLKVSQYTVKKGKNKGTQKKTLNILG